MGIPDMEDHRQIQLVDEPDMLFQPVLFLTLAVIAQADFVDGNHT